MSTQIPNIVIGRLPIYLRALTHLAESGKTNTSSHELGKRLGISSAQIRKDLSHFGEFGKQGTGYHINYLIEQLRSILNLDRDWATAIVGAGFLGHALANYQGFLHRGFRITHIFDKSEEHIGEEMAGIIVKHIDEIVDVLQRDQVQVAIIAVPTIAAQETADLLVEAGITAILNYAPIHLTVPDNVEVRTSDPLILMQQMSYYLTDPEQLSTALQNGISK